MKKPRHSNEARKGEYEIVNCHLDVRKIDCVM